jgi:hypothetical protein
MNPVDTAGSDQRRRSIVTRPQSLDEDHLMLFRAAASISLALASAASVPMVPLLAAPPAATAWEIGPIIRGRNYSVGMPLQPTARRGGGFHIDLPRPPGSAHYVTFRHGSLAGKRQIVMRYRVELARGARIAPPSSPQGDGIITLYFQRGGDTWSGRRQFESYRWYATFATQTLTPGEHVIVAPLSGNWTAVETSSARTNPRGFAAAVAEADRVGFVLGGGDGYGHGVFATGPARIVVTDFRVE